tara:strand:+ start:2232 stop:3296 length:1065 start_codon:yes stop_codon:yes gene_type:complete
MGLPTTHQFSLNPDNPSEGPILVVDSLEYQKSWHTKNLTRSEQARVFDAIDFAINISNTKTTTENITIGDAGISVAVSRTDAETRAMMDAIKLTETVDHAYRDTTNFSAVISSFILADQIKYTHHIPTHHDSPYRLDYVIIKDSVAKKHLQNSHSENNQWPVASTFDTINIKDIIRVEFITKTQTVIGDSLLIREDTDFIHMPDLKGLVYHIDYESFTKFIKLNPKIAYNLSYGSELVNKVILLDQENKIKQYPGESYEEESYLETKSFYIEHGVLQQFLIDYEKDPAVIDRFESLVKNADTSTIGKVDYSNLTANKWVGIKNNRSRGYALSFVMRNLTKIKHMILRFKTRLRG